MGSIDAAEHIGLLHVVAKKYKNIGVPLEDLIQEGSFGLIRAAEKFDPSKGAQFSTYAAYWIRAFIHHFLNRCMRLVTIPERKAIEGRKAGTLPPYPMALDLVVTIDGQDLGPTHEIHADPEAGTPEARAMESERRDAVRKALATLPERTRYILTRRYFCDESLDEVGKQLGLSRSRVQQIEAQGLKSLRSGGRLSLYLV